MQDAIADEDGPRELSLLRGASASGSVSILNSALSILKLNLATLDQKAQETILHTAFVNGNMEVQCSLHPISASSVELATLTSPQILEVFEEDQLREIDLSFATPVIAENGTRKALELAYKLWPELFDGMEEENFVDHLASAIKGGKKENVEFLLKFARPNPLSTDARFDILHSCAQSGKPFFSFATHFIQLVLIFLQRTRI